MQKDSDLVYPYRDRIYLPSQSSGVDTKEYLLRYVEREFPEPAGHGNAIYSVPRRFQNVGERQAGLAEQVVFTRLHGLKEDGQLQGLWLTFFHSASYAGQSFRNRRDGKLMIREHDFVIFAKCCGKYYVLLTEVKSSHDAKTNIENIDVTSDAKVIKNNKRSAQHQLRDHLEVLQSILQCPSINNIIQSYIMWPFLGALTKDPKHAVIRRWKEEPHLHLFEDTLSEQACFNRWFTDVVLTSSTTIQEEHFITLLNRYIILSCGAFVDEINSGMLALLNQEQRDLLNNDYMKGPERFLVVHGAAGTGKTLLVLKKLEQLYWSGRLNEENRALYICYWPGIRCEIQQKLKSLGIEKYVDTTRFYISQTGFLLLNNSNYKHIFMDESEAVCLSFDSSIMKKIISTIFQRYHNGNCKSQQVECADCNLSPRSDECHCDDDWGELWFLVDINQASLFLPKHSPQILKTPHVVLSKVMRSTGYIFDIFRQFYTNPMPMLPQQMLVNMNIPIITLGHHIRGPPIYWVDTDSGFATHDKSLQLLVKVIVDLCATKGFKPNDLCVIPILVSQRFLPESINREIDQYFVDKGYRPRGIGEIETFLTHKEVNDFLVSWVLKIKGLEFKVVLMIIDEDDYDVKDSEDRKKTYIMASRCTCMLILISPKSIKDEIDLYNVTQQYPFHLPF